MIDFDQETWIYLSLIAIAVIYFIWNSSRLKQTKKDRKNHNFRKRYLERKGDKDSRLKRERENQFLTTNNTGELPRIWISICAWILPPYLP